MLGVFYQYQQAIPHHTLSPQYVTICIAAGIFSELDHVFH